MRGFNAIGKRATDRRVIDVSGLTKHYGTYVAVDDVSFRVARGEVVGFLGPNGAGKSTTLRMLAGYLGATRGRVTLGGYDIADEAMLAKQQLGSMPESAALYTEMRVAEYLRFRASLKGVSKRDRETFVIRAMMRAHVHDVREVRIGELSKGYRQRVALADALVADPPILVLDEPTAGMDPNQIRDVRDLLRELSPEKAIILSTHILGEVDAVCTRVIVLVKGRIVAEGPIAELTRGARTVGTGIRFRGRHDLAKALTMAFDEIAKAAVIERGDDEAMLCLYWRSDVPGDRAVAVTEALMERLIAAKMKLRGTVDLAERGAQDLDAIFASLTRNDGLVPVAKDEGKAP